MTHDELTITMFALRYSLGRKTYAFSIVYKYILDHVAEYQSWMLKQMSEEIREATAWHDLEPWEKEEYVRISDIFLEKAGEKDGSKSSTV